MIPVKQLWMSIALCCLPILVFAQTQEPHPKAFKSFAGAKVLFLDYGFPNGVDSANSITNGLEITYRYNINKYLSIGIPLKAGFIDVPEDINNRNFFSADAILRINSFSTESKLIPYALGGAGYVFEADGPRNVQFPAGIGADLRIGTHSYLNLQAEYRFSMEDNRDNLQLGVGLVYHLGQREPDADNDGVFDYFDKCPDMAGPKEAEGCPDRDGDTVPDHLDECPDDIGTFATKGCPDFDNDGFLNAVDECPNEKGTINGCPDRDGDNVKDSEDQCPDEAGLIATNGCPDTDGDGFKDSEDQCPDVSGTINGCPDTDGDGISDKDDQCPRQAGSPLGNGCPDTDGDGIIDLEDRCPEQAGSFGGCPDSDGDGLDDGEDSCPNDAGPASNKGCPELEAEVKEVLKFAMRAVRFKTGKASLLKESHEVLDQIIEIMERYPRYSLLIKGYTDNVGDPSRNLILSLDRAKACYQHLVAGGVSPTRLKYEGYGESDPIADNGTSAGRTLNRRVEFEMFLE